jgi:hypothetical protein
MVSRTDRVRNEVLQSVKQERNVLHTVNRRKATWIGHVFHTTCRIKPVIQEKVMGGNTRNKMLAGTGLLEGSEKVLQIE